MNWDIKYVAKIPVIGYDIKINIMFTNDIHSFGTGSKKFLNRKKGKLRLSTAITYLNFEEKKRKNISGYGTAHFLNNPTILT